MAKKKKSLSDYDGDGVPNIGDCNMFDPNKQDYGVRTPSIRNIKKERLVLYKGIPVNKYVFNVTKGYTVSEETVKRAQKRRPKWNKKPKWVKGI